MANPVKQGMAVAELVAILKNDPAQADAARAELARQQREIDAQIGEDGQQKDDKKHTVCYNASGQIYYRQSKAGATAISKTGSVYQGGCNLDLALVVDLCADTPQSAALRAEMLALRNVDPKERERLIQVAIEKKAVNAQKTIISKRNDLKKLVEQGIATSDALVKYDEKNGLVGLPGFTAAPETPTTAPETAAK